MVAAGDGGAIDADGIAAADGEGWCIRHEHHTSYLLSLHNGVPVKRRLAPDADLVNTCHT